MEGTKASDPEKYARVIIGRWADQSEGTIFKRYGVIDAIPSFAKHCALGLDFGYTHDPTAGVFCAVVGRTLYVDEVCYSTGMLTGDIVRALRPWSAFDIIADSADPRLIDELRGGGLRVRPVRKGAGSVIAGINKMLELDIVITERSVNLRRELDTYSWTKDRDGHYTNEPEDANNHALDAVRYWVLDRLLGWGQGTERRLDGVF